MQLKYLIKDLSIQQIKGSLDVSITGLTAHSKLVQPGYLFIAKKGKQDDGARYVSEAISAGAKAILTDHEHADCPSQVVQLIHPQIATIVGRLAAQYYQFPSHELWMIGITGTNGKTTTSFIIKYLLDQFNHSCGLIGTIEYVVGSSYYPATLTTPDAILNHSLLRQMVQAGHRSAVMEVTSHALDQGRVDTIDYDVAIFSNLTLDHLDYHQTMENYCLAKKRLFKQLESHCPKKRGEKVALVNADSCWQAKILEDCQAKQMTYGIQNRADIGASHVEFKPNGTYLTITYQNQTLPAYWPLIGRFNVYNCLAAIGTGLIRGIPLEAIIEKMSTLPPVKGRLQPVENNLGLNIYVDFAHSDDALLNVLECLTELKQGRLLTVFGCGGDRDQTKRPKMAEVSERFSDLTIVTSDNPRSEDPVTICSEIIQGFRSKHSYWMEIDRGQAIRRAIEMANPGDMILIAGRGHETKQIFSDKMIEFNDANMATKICSEVSQKRLKCSVT